MSYIINHDLSSFVLGNNCIGLYVCYCILNARPICDILVLDVDYLASIILLCLCDAHTSPGRRISEWRLSPQTLSRYFFLWIFPSLNHEIQTVTITPPYRGVTSSSATIPAGSRLWYQIVTPIHHLAGVTDWRLSPQTKTSLSSVFCPHSHASCENFWLLCE